MLKHKTSTKQPIAEIVAWVILCALSIFGISLMYWGTFRGIGVGDDSIYYFSAAKNFLLGKGFSRLSGTGVYTPIIHFPPLYPLILASLQLLFRSELNVIARGINLFLFGSNILLMGLAGKKLTQSWTAGIFASIGILVSPVMLLYRDAMTEPMYITFLLLTLFGIQAYFERSQLKWCILAAMAASSMLLTRYAGLGIVAGFSVAILFFTDQDFRFRLRNTVLFTSIAILPIAAWIIRNYILTGSYTNRVFNVHLPDLSNIKSGLGNIAAWILPIFENFSYWWIIFGFTVYILVVGILWLKNIRENRKWVDSAPVKTILTVILSGMFYFSSLMVSLTFFDASTPLDNRILSPIFVLLLLTFISLTWGGLNLNRKRSLHLLAAILLLVWISISFQVSSAELSKRRLTGFVFDAPIWQNSILLPLLRELPSDTIIYSNESIYLTYKLDRPIRWLPERYDPVKGSLRENYDKQIAEMKVLLQQPYNLVAIFKNRYYEIYYIPLGETFPELQICLDTVEGFFLTTRRQDFTFCK